MRRADMKGAEFVDRDLTLTLYRATTPGALVTQARMARWARRGGQDPVSPRCPYSGGEREDAEHMWYGCPRWACHREGVALPTPEERQRWSACALQSCLYPTGVVTPERAYSLHAMAVAIYGERVQLCREQLDRAGREEGRHWPPRPPRPIYVGDLASLALPDLPL